MSKDSIYDPSQHTTTNEALELSDNALRDALSTDVYKTSTEFKVRVLTLPVPIGQLAESAAVRFIRSGNTNRAVSGSVPPQTQRFSFKGRIVGEPGRPSPHERFLPDPCSISLSTNRLRYATICMLHTTFKSPAGYNGPVPRVGDFVTVTLDAGSIGPFDLQASEFQSLRQKKDVIADALEQEVTCRTLLKEDWTGQRQSGQTRPGSLPVTEEEKIPSSFTVRIPMTGRYSSGYDVRLTRPENSIISTGTTDSFHIFSGLDSFGDFSFRVVATGDTSSTLNAYFNSSPAVLSKFLIFEDALDITNSFIGGFRIL